MCTCKEDKFLLVDGKEIPWDGITPGCVIGRNRIICQECIDNNKRQVVERTRQEIISQLTQLDLKAIRPLMDGNLSVVSKINKQKQILRDKLNSL